MAAFSKITVPLISFILASKLAGAAVADLPITSVDVVSTGSQTASLSATTSSAHDTPSITTSSHVRTHSEDEGKTSETPTAFSSPAIDLTISSSSTAIDLTTTSSSTTSPSYTTLSSESEPTSSYELKDDDYIVLASGDGTFIEIPLPADKVSELGAERTYVAVPLQFKLVPADEAHEEAFSEADDDVEYLTTAPAHTASHDTVVETPASTDEPDYATEAFPTDTAIAAPFPTELLMTGSVDSYTLPVITSTLPPVEDVSMVIPTPPIVTATSEDMSMVIPTPPIVTATSEDVSMVIPMPPTFVAAISAATTDGEPAPVPQTTGVHSEDAGLAAESTPVDSVAGALADDAFAAATNLPVITSTLPPVESESMVIPAPTTFVTATSAGRTDSEPAPVPQTTGVSSEDAGRVAESTPVGSAAGALTDDVFAAATDLPVIPPMAAEGLEKRGIFPDKAYSLEIEDILRKIFGGKDATVAINGEDLHAE